MTHSTPEPEPIQTAETTETAETVVLPDLRETAPAARSAAEPRTRWAGIVWGTVFAAVGLVTALIVASPDRRDAFGGWLASLTVGGFVLVGVMALGCLILVLGLLASARRLQRRNAAS